MGSWTVLAYHCLHQKNRIHNLFNLLKKNGNLLLPNNFRFYFDKQNEFDIKKLFAFGVIQGVAFSDKEGFWHYKDNVITTPNNIRFNIKNFDQLIFSETFLTDTHFSDFDLINKLVIQAGGFIGDTALYYASRGAIVYSFEPDPNSYYLALKNIELNPELSKNIIMRNYAIGSDREVDFPIDPRGSGAASAYNLENKRTIRVKSCSISSIIKEFSIQKPFLLDLDIKGKEFEIIGDRIISQFEMVRIEYSTYINDKQIYSRNDLVSKLAEYGFSKIRVFKHNEGAYDLNNHGTIETIK